MFEEVQTLLFDTILKDNTKDRKRKIIFWYDEKEEYKDFIINFSRERIYVTCYNFPCPLKRFSCSHSITMN